MFESLVKQRLLPASDQASRKPRSSRHKNSLSAGTRSKGKQFTSSSSKQEKEGKQPLSHSLQTESQTQTEAASEKSE